MGYVDFAQLNAAVSSPEQIESTIQYLTEQMRRFLRPHDRMLICFADEGNGSIGNMLRRGKIGFARAQGNDLNSLAFEMCNFGVEIESNRGRDMHNAL